MDKRRIVFIFTMSACLMFLMLWQTQSIDAIMLRLIEGSAQRANAENAANSAQSSAELQPAKAMYSKLKFYTELEDYKLFNLTLNDNATKLLRNGEEWLSAPKGYTFSESFISDSKTLYIKIKATGENDFKWLRACYTHEFCSLNEAVDIKLSQADNTPLTYADNYSLCNRDGFSVDIAECEFEDEKIISYINISALIPEYDEGENIEKREGSFVPLHYTKNGVDLFKNRQLRYREPNDIFDDLPGLNNLNKYFIDDMLTHDSDEYRNPMQAQGIIASNGNWEFFPAKVKYKKYTLDNQPNNEEWKMFFKSKLTELSNSSIPVVITEVWEFNWDGVYTAVVNANNVLPPEEYSSSEAYSELNIPPGGNAVIYNFTAVFTQGSPPLLVRENQQKGAYSPPTYLPDASPFFYALQFNANNEAEMYPVYFVYSSDYDYFYRANIVVSDIDNDSKAELIIYIFTHSSAGRVCKTYKLIDGNPEHILSLALG